MKRLVVLTAAALVLTGCSATAPEPAVTVTSYIAAPAPSVEAPQPTPSVDALIFEALGSGTATVTWVADGTRGQKTVTLPFSMPFIHDGYTAGVVQSEGDTGCTLSRGGVVIDEKQPTAGQHYAECVLND